VITTVASTAECLGVWYNAIWVLALCLAFVETIAVHMALCDVLATPGRPCSYWRAVLLTGKRHWLDLSMVFLWFLVVVVASYSTQREPTPVPMQWLDALYGAAQSMLATYVVMRFALKKSMNLVQYRELLLSVWITAAILGFYALERYVVGLGAFNVTWLVLAPVSYILVIDGLLDMRAYREISAAFSLVRTNAIKDGLLLSVILTLAANLFPVIGGTSHNVRLFIVSVAAAVIAVGLVFFDFISIQQFTMNRRIRALMRARRLRSIWRSEMTTFWRTHVIVRDVGLVLIGIVLVFTIVVFAQAFR